MDEKAGVGQSRGSGWLTGPLRQAGAAVSLCLFVAAGFGLLAGQHPVSAAGAYVVIVNNDVADASMSLADLGKIYLGDKKTWSNDAKVVVTVASDGPHHEAFLKEVTKKTPSQFDSYWKNLVFTGKGVQPKSFKKPEEMVAFVAKTAGAVGYLPPDAAHDGVKVLEIK